MHKRPNNEIPKIIKQTIDLITDCLPKMNQINSALRPKIQP